MKEAYLCVAYIEHLHNIPFSNDAEWRHFFYPTTRAPRCYYIKKKLMQFCGNFSLNTIPKSMTYSMNIWMNSCKLIDLFVYWNSDFVEWKHELLPIFGRVFGFHFVWFILAPIFYWNLNTMSLDLKNRSLAGNAISIKIITVKLISD